MMGDNSVVDKQKAHRDKWVNASRFLRAKKCVDGVLYLGDLIKPPNVNCLGACGVDIFEYVCKLRRTFYIECGNLLDAAVGGKLGKKNLVNRDKTAEQIYYERDKNSAHADADYVEPTFANLTEMAKVMKQQMKCVRRECGGILPTVLKAEYVSFDPLIARIVYGVFPQKELEAKHRQHPLYVQCPPGAYKTHMRKVFSNMGQLSDVIKNPDDFSVMVVDGLFPEESLQNFQDACVRINIIFGSDMWVHKGKSFDFFKNPELIAAGLADEFGQPILLN